MSRQSGMFLSSLFRRLLQRRLAVLLVFGAVCVPMAIFAGRVRQDNSPDRLIIHTDPDYLALKEFDKVFGGGDSVLLLAAAKDPFASEVLSRLDALERALAAIPHVTTSSALSTFRRVHNGFDATAEQAAAFRAFASPAGPP